LILARAVRFVFPDGTRLEFPDFEAGARERWLVHGPSGCGKTTLLHLLCGLRRLSGGLLSVDGHEPVRMSGAERDRWRGQRIGLVLQQPHLVPGLSVEGNLRVARYCAKLPADEGRIREVLGALGLNPLASRPIHALSQGQAQRVAVARALVNRPVLILADEPTASLDDDHATGVYQLLEESAEQAGATLMVVTHDRRLRELVPHHLELAAMAPAGEGSAGAVGRPPGGGDPLQPRRAG